MLETVIGSIPSHVAEGRGAGALPSRDPRPTARLLIDAVQGAPAQSYPWEEIDLDDALHASLSHGVTPALAVHVRGRADVPGDFAAKLQACYRDQLARHLRTLADLRRLAGILDGAGLRWAVVKGPALAERLWPRPDLRLYVDLDIIVERQRLKDAVELLEGNGVTLVDRNWPFMLERVQGELSMALPYGTPLDLHWHLVNDRGLRKSFAFPMDEILDRAAPTQLGSVVAPVMDPVDTVLHLAYHMVHSGGHRLVWLRDFHLAVSSPDLDWDELTRRAHRYGCSLALALSLRRTERVLCPPGGYPRAPRAGIWGHLAARADSWRPVPQLPGERRSGRIVFQSTRAGFAASLAAGASAAVGRTHSDDDRPPGDTNPLHLVRDDARSRHRYFEIVGGPTQP